jgi:hypothetical protein
MSVEQSVEWELVGETEVVGVNLPQCHFVHHKSHTTWPDLEPRQPRLTAWAMARPQHNSNFKYNLLQNTVYRVYLRISFVSQVIPTEK